MNKEQLKKSEGTFVYLDPPPIKLQGLRFEEWVTMWRVEKIYDKNGLFEISNPYFDYHKQLSLDIVKNFDEDYKFFKFPYQINGILKLYAQLQLDGYRVIVENNKARWSNWHYRNYCLKKRIAPSHTLTSMEVPFLKSYYGQ